MDSLKFSPLLLQGTPKGNLTERCRLLEFWNRVGDDPNQIILSWNDTVDFCHWQGTTCGHRHPGVTKLELPDSRFRGSLSPSNGNLIFLRIININNNGFTCKIPPRIGNLHRLTELALDNNSFAGKLQENISSGTNIREICLEKREHFGEIPRGLAICQSFASSKSTATISWRFSLISLATCRPWSSLVESATVSWEASHPLLGD